LFISTTNGQLCCLSGDGDGLVTLSAKEVEDLNQNSTPPSPPRRKSAKKPAGAKTTRLPSKNADFDKIDQTRAFQAELGYRLASDASQGGMALQALDTPLTGKVTLECTLQYANGDGSNNGYLAFGDGANEEQLVKCGLRKKMGTAAILQGPLAANEGPTTPCVTGNEKQYELTVTVDLASGSVTLQGAGVTVNANLERPMKSITHVGYCLKGTIVDFSPIEASSAP
jgi:hypothetical protein